MATQKTKINKSVFKMLVLHPTRIPWYIHWSRSPYRCSCGWYPGAISLGCEKCWWHFGHLNDLAEAGLLNNKQKLSCAEIVTLAIMLDESRRKKTLPHGKLPRRHVNCLLRDLPNTNGGLRVGLMC